MQLKALKLSCKKIYHSTLLGAEGSEKMQPVSTAINCSLSLASTQETKAFPNLSILCLLLMYLNNS